MRDAEDYATYAVRMWLMNDEYDYKHACSLVEDAGSVYDGADELKDWIEEAADELLDGRSSMFTDMLGYMLQSVDWQELARAFKPDEWGDSDEAPEDEDDDERIDSDEWQAGIEAIRDREGREDRMSDRAIYNEGRLDAYDVYDTPAGCRGCGAVISRGEQHARSCENAED